MVTKLKESRKESLVDTIGNVVYPLITGSFLDYASGLRGLGIVASRTCATGVNIPTGRYYGKWRNIVFKATKTNKESSKIRKGLADLFAFNTFQTPLYGGVVAAGSLISNLVSEGNIEVDWYSALEGIKKLAMISPFLAPTQGWCMDKLRKVFNLKSASEKAADSLETYSNLNLEATV